MADCKHMACPVRSNSTSNPYHCDCTMRQNRNDDTVLIVSNHTLDTPRGSVKGGG